MIGLFCNFFIRVELESLNSKDGTIDSGAIVLNNNVELRIANYTYNLMFFALHGVFIVIDSETGIATVEF